MKFKLSHLLILIGGVVIVFFLGFLPKFVVSDKEKRLKETEQKVKNEVAQKLSSHTEEGVNNVELKRLKSKLKTVEMPLRLFLVDSIAQLYRNAFVLDSAMIVYMSYASNDRTFYLKAVRDGLTGLRMSPKEDKKRYYVQLCDRAINQGLEKHPDYLELQVEKLRLQVFTAAMNGQPPMKGIFQLKELIASNPGLIAGRVALAEFYTTVGKSEEAIEQYVQVLDFDQDNLQAHVELVSLYVGTGKNTKAKEYLTQLQELNRVTKDSFIEGFIEKSLRKLN